MCIFDTWPDIGGPIPGVSVRIPPLYSPCQPVPKFLLAQPSHSKYKQNLTSHYSSDRQLIMFRDALTNSHNWLKEMYYTWLGELVFRAREGWSHPCVHLKTKSWNNLSLYVVVLTKSNPWSFPACVYACSGQEKLQVAVSALEIPWREVTLNLVMFC